MKENSHIKKHGFLVHNKMESENKKSHKSQAAHFGMGEGGKKKFNFLTFYKDLILGGKIRENSIGKKLWGKPLVSNMCFS